MSPAVTSFVLRGTAISSWTKKTSTIFDGRSKANSPIGDWYTGRANTAAQAFDLFSAKGHGAEIGFDQTGDDVEDGCFAAAAGPDNADEVTLVDIEAEVFENGHFAGFAAERLANLANTELN